MKHLSLLKLLEIPLQLPINARVRFKGEDTSGRPHEAGGEKRMVANVRAKIQKVSPDRRMAWRPRVT